MSRGSWLFALVAIIAILSLVSCGDNPAEALVAGAVNITTSPLGLKGIVAHESDTITVKVADANFNPVRNVAVVFEVFDTTTKIKFLDAVTNAKGELRILWIFGKKAGHQEIAATIKDRIGNAQQAFMAAEVSSEVANTVSLTPPVSSILGGAIYKVPNHAADVYGNEVILTSWQTGFTAPRRPTIWSSADSLIARVDTNGVVTAVRSGSTSITAQIEGKSASIPIKTIGALTLSSSNHYCFVLEDFRTACGGNDNTRGEFGTGNRNALGSPYFVNTTAQFFTVQTGGESTCALSRVGELYCWGYTRTGPDLLVPTPIGSGLRFSSITGSRAEFCGLTTSNELYCWLDAFRGRPDLTVPVQLFAGRSVNAVAVGSYESCAIVDIDNVYCWSDLQPNPKLINILTRFTKLMMANDHICGLTFDGSAYCGMYDRVNGLSVQPTLVTGGQRYTNIVVFGSGLCGLTTENTVWCWGADNVATLRTNIKFKTLDTGFCGVTELGVPQCATENGFRYFSTPTAPN